jgi:DNA topoisomerase-1
MTKSPSLPRCRPVSRLDDVTLEEASELFKLPRIIGKTADGQDIGANFGRFGPYVKWGSKNYVSIKPDDPFSITLERALQLIAEKQAADAAKHIKTFEADGISIMNGRFGPTSPMAKRMPRFPKVPTLRVLTSRKPKSCWRPPRFVQNADASLNLKRHIWKTYIVKTTNSGYDVWRN